VGGDVAVYVLAAIEDAPVNANVGATTPLGAIALQLARRTPTNFGGFALRKKLGLWHVRVTLLPLRAADDTNLGMVTVIFCQGLLLDTSPLFSPPADERTPLLNASPVQFVYQFNHVNI
jgi:hypothetical protein